jgi:hypothetical protein
VRCRAGWFCRRIEVASLRERPGGATANDAQRSTGAPNPPFTAPYSGFQFSETSAVLGGALAFSTPATVNSPAGSYAITPSSLTSTSYTITYVNGTLAMSGLPPSVPGGNVFSAQMAAVQRINGGEIRLQEAACLCPPKTARSPVLDGVVAGSPRRCESTLDKNVLDTAPAGQCFFLSSNEY